MAMFNCVIVDDIPSAIDDLTYYIDLIPNLTLTKAYVNPFEALLEITSGDTIDLLFVNITMAQMSWV